MSNNYFDIALDKPADATLEDGGTCSYTANDASCGDLDGDGEYEIIVKWDCNGQDNSSMGVTGDVLLDAYKMDGKRLWRINLGKNIRAGAHYTQFLVYDFDGDGKAEMTCKTAPGSTDSKGRYVTAASHVAAIRTVSETINKTDYRNANGYILDGDEYLTVFNGLTGEAIDTIYYPNQRLDASVWGDENGNRVDRYTASVAYIDGVTPYAFYMRGYYMGSGSQRQAACAVSFDGKELDCRYSFDTYDVNSYNNKSTSASYDADGNYKGVNGFISGNEKFVGQGNHNCAVADVDSDGKDEVITGALCYELKDNGILGVKWCTFLEHGDALHIGDYDPTHEGFEFFTVHEEGDKKNTEGDYGKTNAQGARINFGESVIDPGIDCVSVSDSAYDKLIMFHEGAPDDTGRGVMANIGMGGYYQFWSSANTIRIARGGTTFDKGTDPAGITYNFRIFWDGDLYDELMDGTGRSDTSIGINSWNGSNLTRLFTTDANYITANGTKSTPALSADLFGDWREELVMRKSDDTGLRIYSTTTPSNYKIKTLMQDPVYRSGVSAEQTAYNQPPHVGFHLSDEIINKGGVKSISVTSKKDSYNAGESIDRNTLTVTAAYKNGTTANVSEYSISGYNENKAGEQTLTVFYGGKTDTFTVTVTTFEINADGVITNYYGSNTTETIPESINGITVKGIAANALANSSIKKLYIFNESIDIADNSLPQGITVWCLKDSPAEAYAKANGIKYKLLGETKEYINVTFEEDGYKSITDGTALVKQATETVTNTISPLVFTALPRSSSDNKTGIYTVKESDNTYLQCTAKYASANQHSFISFADNSFYDGLDEYTMAFDFKLEDNETDLTLVLLSSGDGRFADGAGSAAKADADSNTVYSMRIGKDSVAADTWYHYELKRSGNTYSQKITNKATDEVISTPATYTNANPLAIAFWEKKATTYAYIDNLSIMTIPGTSDITLNITDASGELVPNASVTIDGETKTTDEDGTVTFEGLTVGKYDVTVTHDELTAYETTAIVIPEPGETTIRMDSSFPPVEIIFENNVAKVNRKPGGQMIVAVYDEHHALMKVDFVDGYEQSLDEYTDGFETTVFLWNSITDITPVCDSRSE